MPGYKLENSTKHPGKIFRYINFILAISVAGCSAAGDKILESSSKNSSLKWITDTSASTHAENGVANLQFIGAGGVYLSFPQGGVLVDPFYSNPGILSLASLRTLTPDTQTIDRYLPPLNDINAVLIGHVHFDHALDLPYIAGKLVENARIYGSATLKNSLATAIAPDRLIDVEPSMSVDGRGGRWLMLSPHLRVFPIKSEHAPHIGSWVFGSGNIEKPLDHVPRDALDWRAGVNISYLIDLLDDEKKPLYRIFIQTSASSSPNGLAPNSVLDDGKAVDMAVLCAANYSKMEHYPEYLLERMNPQKVVLVHWEKFWTPYEPGQASPLPGLSLDNLYQRINAVLPQAEVSILQRSAIMRWSLDPGR